MAIPIEGYAMYWRNPKTRAFEKVPGVNLMEPGHLGGTSPAAKIRIAAWKVPEWYTSDGTEGWYKGRSRY